MPATIVDSDVGHEIRGTAGNDIIAARGGDDVVLGMGGADRICLGTGRDIGKGGEGNDEFLSEPTADGRDDFYGDSGQDSVRYIGRSTGVSVSLDGVANDGQSGEQDNVRFSTENVQGTPFADQILGNELDNVFIGSSGNDDLRGGPGDDDLYGVQGDDLLIGDAGDDHLSGYDGDDRLLASESLDGDDEMFGGLGSDTMDYSDRSASLGVTVILDNDFNDGSAGEFDIVETDIENLIGSPGADTLDVGFSGTDVSNVLNGGLGNDTLRTTDGDGLDTAVGGLSTDQCFTDPGDLRIGCNP
ncbi:MAG TPA: hypothetical protein VLL08_02785 [Kineosporiaceae bacterium]|nr:hypothetical protein [Kineosporiaceae bacterium]